MVCTSNLLRPYPEDRDGFRPNPLHPPKVSFRAKALLGDTWDWDKGRKRKG